MTVDTLAVIGAGAMGRGIIEVAAVNGLNVDVFEINNDQATAAAERFPTLRILARPHWRRRSLGREADGASTRS